MQAVIDRRVFCLQRVEQGLRDVASPLPSLVSSIRHSKMYQFLFQVRFLEKGVFFPPVQFKHKCRRKKVCSANFVLGKNLLPWQTVQLLPFLDAFGVDACFYSFLTVPKHPSAPCHWRPEHALRRDFATRLRCHCRLPMKEATVICSFWKRSLFNDGAPGWQRKSWVCSTWRWERLPLNTYSTATGTRKAFSFNIHT